VDVLSDALNVVRLAGAVFFTATFSSRWAIASPDREDLARFLHLPSHCITLFHILAAGRGWIRFEGSHPIPIEAGDVVVFPHGTAHEMGSDLDTIPQSISAILPTLPGEKIPQIKIGGGSPRAHFICGYLHCEQQFNPLLESLPRLLVIRAHQHPNHAQPPATDGLPESNVVYVQSGDWLEMTRRSIIEEADGEQQGQSAMLVRLTEVLFVEIVRRYMQQLSPAQRGWLAGVRDPIIGHTLRLLHTHPEHEWTVDQLAQAVGLARSTLAQRFREIMGESPMRYLAGWRMQVAQHLLRQTSLSIREIAEETGYESEAAFSRAFKRYYGQPPAMWRMESR